MIIPLCIGLIVAGVLCLAGVSLFTVNQKGASDAGRKSTGRAASRSTERSHLVNSGEGVRSAIRQSGKDDGVNKDKKTEGKESLVAKKKLSEQRKEGLEILQKGARSISGITNQSLVIDETAILRAALLKETYHLALRSQTPSVNLVSIAGEYHRLGDSVQTRDILQKSLDLAIYPNQQQKTSEAVTAVFRGMLSLNQFALAEDALQNIPNELARKRAKLIAASQTAIKGDVKRARRIIASMTDVSDQELALIVLSASEASYEGVSKALQTTYSILDKSRKNRAYQRIALVRGSLGDFSGANQAFQQINDAKVSESTSVSLAKLQARKGDLHGTLNTIHYLKNPEVADVALNDLSQQLAVSGRFSNSAFVSNHIIGDTQRSQALEKLSLEQAKSGDLSGSLIRTNSIPSEMIRNRSMIALSGLTANQATTGQARNIATMIESEIQRDRAYKVIAQAAAAVGNQSDAYNTLQQISRTDEKTLALISLARTRQKQGDGKGAFAMLENASSLSQHISSENTLDRILSDMALAYAERGESSRSLSLASTIISESKKNSTYQKLTGIFSSNDVDAAQFSILSITVDKTRKLAEESLSKALAKSCVQNGNEKSAISQSRQLETDRQKIIFLLGVSKLI